MLLPKSKRAYVSFTNGTIETSEGTFKRFGDTLPISPEMVLSVLSTGAGILTPEEFESVGFTEAERKNHKARKGPEFVGRQRHAKQLMAAMRARLLDSRD